MNAADPVTWAFLSTGQGSRGTVADRRAGTVGLAESLWENRLTGPVAGPIMSPAPLGQGAPGGLTMAWEGP